MLQKLIVWLKFQWEHNHELTCTNEPTGLTGSEASYWHRERCWCGHNKIAMTGWCEGQQT